MNDDLHPDTPDPLDDELRRRFGAGAGDADPDIVLDSMRPQLQRARSRRRASFAGAAAGLAAVVVVLVVALGSGGGGGGSVSTPPASQGPVRTAPTTPTTTPSGGSVTPDSVPAATGDTVAGTTDTTVPSGGATPETPPTAPTTVPASRDEGFSSAGGSIVVRLAGGQISLASQTPAAGYSSEVHDNGPTRVEVRFTNGGTEWRIRVDLDNGTLVPEVTQH